MHRSFSKAMRLGETVADTHERISEVALEQRAVKD